MSDLFDGLRADPYDRIYSNRQLVQRIAAYLRPHLLHVSSAALLIILISILTSIVPLLIASGIDQVVAQSLDRSTWLFGALIIGTPFVAWALNFARQRITATLIGKMIYELQIETAQAALAKDMFFFDRNSVGRIVSRITGDTEAFSTVLTLTLNLVSHLFLIISLSIIMLTIDPALTFVTLSLAPVIILAALAFRRVGREAALQTRQVMSSVNANMYESMSGISVAKNFGQEDKLYQEFAALNQLSYRVYTHQGLIYSAILPILNGLTGVGTLVVLYFGWQALQSGAISAGDWYLFIQALGLLWTPLTQAASFWSLFQLGLAASERIFAFMDSDDRIKQQEEQPLTHLRGRIEMIEVDFGYQKGEDVLKGFALTVAPGEKIAIVGHTGAGKSSIAKLIARFYEFQAGQILIDGQDIRRLDLQTYRSQLGMVPQHPFLFSGSVKANIGYVKPEATAAEISHAARQVGGGDWLDYLPNGIDTIIKENGRGLSMGQRQMIALARVFLKAPALIIFDEATASIDPLAEAQIQESLIKLFHDRTVMIIAHRLSTIKNADRIISLHKGKIIEQGTFDELLCKGGYFAELYTLYYKHQEVN